MTVRFWASVDVIHLMIAGPRVKSLHSHLSATDFAQLSRDHGAVAAGLPPLPTVEAHGRAVDVERTATTSGIVSLAGHQLPAAEILPGRRVAISIEQTTLMIFVPTAASCSGPAPNRHRG
jgi:hypothetical protein